MSGGPLLTVDDLHVSFDSPRGVVHAVNGVSFELERGETLGLVGESGCGKSATLRAIGGLLPGTARTSGSVTLEGTVLERQAPRPQIATIFQDPATHLNPVQTVGRALVETLRIRQRLGREEARASAIGLLERVEISRAAARMSAYPHELSGGMRQRVMIALALACRPLLLLADEPTTALDVTTQHRVLQLLERLREETGMAMVFVSHDLAVVADVCDTAAVMYGGLLVERDRAALLMRAPHHPYSDGLVRSIPTLDPDVPVEAVPGVPPDLLTAPTCCPYIDRCVRRTAVCGEYVVTATTAERFTACTNPIARS